MHPRRLKILLIIEQCNPEWFSVPLVGYRFYEGISRLADTTLVTHERNRAALTKAHPNQDIVYIFESKFIKRYYKIAERLSKIGNKIIWPLYNTLSYPVYGEFNHLVYTQFKDEILAGHYDIVHAITPMIPRYPVKTVKLCHKTPFIIGPVNGGVPYPKGFQDVARKELAGFNFLRLIGRFIIPGYRETYEQASHILAGSTYTLNLIQDLFKIEKDHIQLFYENGIDHSFIKDETISALNQSRDRINLLFVGRLVPYKGADMLIQAISELTPAIQNKITLTIVGDGSERKLLTQRVETLNLTDKIHFTGWIDQQATLQYYRQSDIFCFPSIREFGGAVVIEAMANGLPCIVVNNGGIGEYVTEETGFRINPVSRNFVIQELKNCIEQLVDNPELQKRMSSNAIQRAKAFAWNTKTEQIINIYHQALAR